MALTKEDLDNIKLPLSDEDYRMLRIEDAKTSYKLWSLASPELREAFDNKEDDNTCTSQLPPKKQWNEVTGKIAHIMEEPEDED